MFLNGSVHAEQSSLLHEASAKGEIEHLKKLLAEGSEINLQDHSGKTALHYAAENGHGGTVTVLLENGADATVKDINGLTAYDYALRNGHKGTASILKPYSECVRSFNPGLKYRTQADFENAIHRPVCLLKDENVWFFAPREYETASKTIFSYLIKASTVISLH